MTVYITKEKRKWKIVDKPDGPISDDLPPITIKDFNVKDQKRLRNIVSPEQLLKELKERKPKKGKKGIKKKRINRGEAGKQPPGLATRLKRTKTEVYKKKKAEELEKAVKKEVEKTKPKVVKSPFTATENAPENIVVSLPKAKKPKAKEGSTYSLPTTPRAERGDSPTEFEAPFASLREKKRHQANARLFAKESAAILKPFARKPITPPAAEPKEPKPLKPRNLKEEKTPESQAAQAKETALKRHLETEAVKRGEEEARAKRLTEIENKAQARKNAKYKSLSAKIRETLPKYGAKKKAEKEEKEKKKEKLITTLQTQARRKSATSQLAKLKAKKQSAEREKEKEERSKMGAEDEPIREKPIDKAEREAQETIEFIQQALNPKEEKAKDKSPSSKSPRTRLTPEIKAQREAEKAEAKAQREAEKEAEKAEKKALADELKRANAEAKAEQAQFLKEKLAFEKQKKAASKIPPEKLESLLLPDYSPPVSPAYEDLFNLKPPSKGKKPPPPPTEPSPKDQPKKKTPSPKEIPPPPKETPPKSRKPPPPPPPGAEIVKAKPPSPAPINVEEYIKESIPKSSNAQAPTLALMEQREKEIQAELRKSPGDRKLTKELSNIKGNIGLLKKTSTKGSSSEEETQIVRKKAPPLPARPKKAEPEPAPPKLSMREQAEADEKESLAKEIATTKNKLEQSKAKLVKLNPGDQYYPRDKAITKTEIKRYEDRLAALENPTAAAESKSSLPIFELSEREAKTSKKREPDISIFNKPPPKGSGLGGKLKGHQVNKFVEASYKKLDDAHKVDDYELDKELSTKNNKVYRDPATGKVVIANAGTSSLTDWWNNKNILFGNYSKTKRYKEVEDIQKKAIQKYGKDNIMNVGHSQSGEALRIMKQRELLGEAVAVNPAIIGKSTEDIDVIRSNRDLVSLLTPTSGKDTTIQAQSYNPLTEHSSNIISGENEEKEFGRGFRIKHRNY